MPTGLEGEAITLSSCIAVVVGTFITGADLGGGCRGLLFSNTTGILKKKKSMWFIGVEVKEETSAPPPKKCPGSAPVLTIVQL